MNIIPKKVDSQFLIRIIKNEAGSEEKEYFEKWLTESDENREEFGNLILLWEKLAELKTPPAPDPHLQWAKISQETIFKKPDVQIDEKRITLTQPSKINSNFNEKTPLDSYRKDYGWIIRFAAMIIIAAGIFLIYDNYYVPGDLENRISPAKDVANRVVNYEVKTTKGQRTTLTLSDGSIVSLNSDSKLTYPSNFINNERRIELVGEAYFRVASDLTKPFFVVSGEMTTMVTGTEFNIKNRNNKVSVIVAEGSVKTYSNKNPQGISLKKGEMVSLYTNGQLSKQKTVDLNHFLAWRKNKLSFSNTSLSDVMADIERYYNVSVRFNDNNNKSRTLTGIFETDSLEHILSIISLTLDIRISQDGKKIYVY